MRASYVKAPALLLMMLPFSESTRLFLTTVLFLFGFHVQHLFSRAGVSVTQSVGTGESAFAPDLLRYRTECTLALTGAKHLSHGVQFAGD